MKKILTILLCFGAIFNLTACGEKSENSNKSNSNNTNSITEVKQSEIIKKLEEKLNMLGDAKESFSYREARTMLKEVEDIYYFNDDYMIAQAIDVLTNGFENVSFEKVDNYIKNFFNVTSYEYENLDLYCTPYSGYKYDKTKNAYVSCYELPTGGWFTSFIDVFNLQIIKYEQNKDYYIVSTKAITAIQDGEEYFCLGGPTTQNMSIKIFDDFDFKAPKIDKSIAVTCSNVENAYENNQPLIDEIKEKANYNSVIENAPIFKFFFTKDNLLIDRVEKQ